MNPQKNQTNSSAQDACVAEINAVLDKHGFALQAFSQPGIRLLELPKESRGQDTNVTEGKIEEDNGNTETQSS